MASDDKQGGDDRRGAGSDYFERAKRLLMGAFDTVFEIARKGDESQSNELSQVKPRPSTSQAHVQSHFESASGSRHSPHGLLDFGPSKVYNTVAKQKGKGGSKAKPNNAKQQWRSDCICLSDCEQSSKPSSR